MLNYNQYILENIFTTDVINTFNDIDILESIVTDTKSLLNSIEAKEFDLYYEFDIDSKYKFETIEDLYNNENFNATLFKKKLKKDNIESTDESETFIDKTINVKFFLIHRKDDNQLSKPIAIIFQSKLKNNNKWDKLKAYYVNQDMKKFYDKLSSKTIEITKNNKKYIYLTSNSGNDWVLQSPDMEDDIFKQIISQQDIKAILKDKNVNITIIE